MKTIPVGTVLGAMAGFVLLVVGLFLFGPCGPSSPVVHILLFPGLELSYLMDDPWKGDQVIFVVQPVFGAIVGALIGWRRSASSSATRQQATATNLPSDQWRRGSRSASTRLDADRAFLHVLTVIVVLVGIAIVVAAAWWIPTR